MKTFATDCSHLYIYLFATNEKRGRDLLRSFLKGIFAGCRRKSWKKTPSYKRILHVIQEYSLKGKIRVKRYLLRFFFFFQTTAMIVRLFVQADFPVHDCTMNRRIDSTWRHGVVEAILFHEEFFFFFFCETFPVFRNSIYYSFLISFLSR